MKKIVLDDGRDYVKDLKELEMSSIEVYPTPPYTHQENERAELMRCTI